MPFHYALVDDLIPEEEFIRRVENKIEEYGDLIDESTAAMIVVGELGRAHVKINALSGRSSLFSFFGKVIDKTDIRKFDRADGEKGTVATLLVGDDSGTARIVLWDERAAAVKEISIGDVLEIIGRHSGRESREITALAMRRASCQIECNVPPNGSVSLNPPPVNLDVLILGTEAPRAYSRRDGTTGELVEAVAGDSRGTFRIVVWAPQLFLYLQPETAVHITGAKPDGRGGREEYSLDEKSTIEVSGLDIKIPLTDLGTIHEGGIYSVSGTVRDVQNPRSFKSRNGSPSWVRTIIITDEKDSIPVVIWGEKALSILHKGDRVRLYNGKAKTGRSGGVELHAGRGSALLLPEALSAEIIVEGIVIVHDGHTFIDNGQKRYLVDKGDLPLWQEVRGEGRVSGDRIQLDRWEHVHLSVIDLKKRAQRLRHTLGD